MTRSVISAFAILLCCSQFTNAADVSMEDYIKDFSGRWVCEAVADNDVEGYWSKGDSLRFVIVHAPTKDFSGVRYEWQVEKDGKVAGKAHGITTWDPGMKCMRTVGFAVPGFLVNATIIKDGNTWIDKSVITYPDASKGTATAAISASSDGKKHTNAITERVSHEGQKLPDITRVWNKVSMNHEMLDKHLGWLVGTWEAELDTPEQGLVDVTATYKWIADGAVMTLDLKIGEWENLSLILFDPSDETIKMWGANSYGGSGQALMRIDGDELVWTNTVYDQYGRKETSDFTYVKKDAKTMYVKFIDDADGQEKNVLNTKVK